MKPIHLLTGFLIGSLVNGLMLFHFYCKESSRCLYSHTPLCVDSICPLH